MVNDKDQHWQTDLLGCVSDPLHDAHILLDIEIQMTWEFQFCSQNLLIDSKWIVIKERWIPVERQKRQPSLLI